MAENIVQAVLARAGKAAVSEARPEGNYGKSIGDDYWSKMATEFCDAVHAKDHEGMATILRAMHGADSSDGEEY